jgi:hypothetical protein
MIHENIEHGHYTSFSDHKEHFMQVVTSKWKIKQTVLVQFSFHSGTAFELPVLLLGCSCSWTSHCRFNGEFCQCIYHNCAVHVKLFEPKIFKAYTQHYGIHMRSDSFSTLSKTQCKKFAHGCTSYEILWKFSPCTKWLTSLICWS